MSSIATLEQESEDLELHVKLCTQRYEQLDSRLNAFEGKVDKLTEKVENLRSDLWKVFIGTSGTMIASVISVLIVLLLK